MAQIKNLLGHATLEMAKGQRICHRNRKAHKIMNGEAFLLVRAGRFEEKNYCRECAVPMLDKAKQEVGALLAGLALEPRA
jgi:hypothetical protein